MATPLIKTVCGIPVADTEARQELDNLKGKAIVNISQKEDGKIELTYGDGTVKEIEIKAVVG